MVSCRLRGLVVLFDLDQYTMSPSMPKTWHIGEGLGTGTVHLLPLSVEVLGRRRTGYWKCASSTSFCESPR